MTAGPDELLDDAIAEVEDATPVDTGLPSIEPSSPGSSADGPGATGGYALTVADDRLSATITFPPLKDRPRPELRAVLEDLAREHHLSAVDEDALTEALADAIRSSEEPVSGVIARGTPPVAGADGWLEWLGDFFHSHAIRLPDGRVDHYHHTKVSVYEGQPLLVVHRPTKGTAGEDVFGRSLRAAPGKPAPLQTDDTVAPHPQKSGLLVAARAGMVEYARDQLSIGDVQAVDAVDFSTGSIDFEGAVQVRDDVAAKFSVYGAGTVIIGGHVENARIESRRGIQIDKGVMGHREAELRCEGDILLGYAREATVHCGGRLVARRELLWCGGEVHEDLLVESGRVVGGHWRVGGCAVIDELGSREEITTLLTLGEAPEQNRELHRLTRARKEAQRVWQEFRRRYGPFLRGEAGNLPVEEREALQQRAWLLEREASRSRKREFLLRIRLHRQRRRSYAWVKTRVHAGVRIALDGGKVVHEFVEARPGPVCIRYDAEAKKAQLLSCALEDCEIGLR